VLRTSRIHPSSLHKIHTPAGGKRGGRGHKGVNNKSLLHHGQRRICRLQEEQWFISWETATQRGRGGATRWFGARAPPHGQQQQRQRDTRTPPGGEREREFVRLLFVGSPLSDVRGFECNGSPHF
jgi:hypothetical protein